MLLMCSCLEAVHQARSASYRCRVPLTYLRETKKFVVPELPEAPLIVFINSRSGGRAGPKLAETLFHALGHSQVRIIRFFAAALHPLDCLPHFSQPCMANLRCSASGV